MRPRPATLVFLVAAIAGLVFTAYSTSDFVAHLDRQVHAIHCSFIPGIVAADNDTASGCHAALMSPYSSILRSWIWGGLPMSLLGLATFAFLLFRGVDLFVNQKQSNQAATLFLLVASVLPVLTSIVMGGISVFALGELCKVCIGIYLSSFVCLGAAIWAYVASRIPSPEDWVDPMAPPPETPAPTMEASLPVVGLVGFAEGCAFVGITGLLYLLVVPDFSHYVGSCGVLPKPEDPSGIMITIGGTHGGKPAIEVLDPLCPACRALDGRLAASNLGERIDRKAVLFPLDTTCNWMVGSSLHPGACTVSEAVLCAGEKADDVIAWSFAHQDEVKDATAKDPAAAARMVGAAFPTLQSCIGSAAVKQRLNRSLRWAVANKLPVLTPQLYVDGVKLCDEDTDLGLDYSLSRLLVAAKGAP
jgi:uncharacterized membrane protein